MVSLLEHLIGEGRSVHVFDPHIRLDSIFGSNREYLVNAIPEIGNLLDGSSKSVLGWAQHLVVPLRIDDTLDSPIAKSESPVLDLAAHVPLGVREPETQSFRSSSSAAGWRTIA